MTDDELAAYLHLTPEEAAEIIPKITPARRKLYEHMVRVEAEANAWARGEGPKPKGVLIDLSRNARRSSYT